MSIFPADLLEKARALGTQCTTHHQTIATAESCTGGLLSALFTEVFGASKWFTHGFVTYANEAKIDIIGVDPKLIVDHGAVSEQVARAMAEGALRTAKSTIGIGITGIAGPDGGTPQKPVGTVHIAVASRDGKTIHKKCQFTGDRSQIRLSAAAKALEMLLSTM